MTRVLVARTGDRVDGGVVADFAPCVPAVDDDGVVRFQATLGDGSVGIWAGDGGPLVEVSRGGACSHPDSGADGTVAFYALEVAGVALVRVLGDQTDVVVPEGIGPLGPTVDDHGRIAFRTRSGAHVAVDGVVHAVVETGGEGGWTAIHGLPVASNDGAVVVRVDGPGGPAILRWTRAGTTVVAGEGFADLGRFPSASGSGRIGFVGTPIGGRSAAYVAVGGRLALAVDDPAFASFRGALVDDRGGLAWIATPVGGSLGVYTPSRRVVGLGDAPFGVPVTDLALNPVSCSASGRLAVRLAFADGGQAIVRYDPVHDGP